jgi:hypothetical protein
VIATSSLAETRLVPIGPELHVNGSFTADVSYPDADMDDAGRFVVTWDDGDEIAARRYDGQGEAQGAPFQVNTLTTGDQARPAVAMTDGGAFVVVWQDDYVDGFDWGIAARRYDASGAPAGSEFTVNTYTPDFQYRPAVDAAADGSFVVTWLSYNQTHYGDLNDVYAQRFDGAGAPAGGEFSVWVDEYEGAAHPAIGVRPGGEFVVVWESYLAAYGVYARRFDGSGVPMVGRVPITTGDQRDPRIAVAPDGTAFVVWITDCCGASNIGGRLYDATGSPLGSEFVVNTYTTGAQTYPDVGVDAAGSFLVVWDSSAPGTEHDGIFGRLFDVAGTGAGADFAISAGSGGYPATDGGPAGEFVVAWHDSVPPDSAILARRFGPALQVGVGAKKLIVVDKVTTAGKAKVVYVSKDQTADITKGSGTDVDGIGVAFSLAYADGSATGGFVLPTGANDGLVGWKVNQQAVAKYVNKVAPGAATQAKVAVIKPGKLLKLVGLGLGDTPIDILGAGAPSTQPVGAVVTAYCVDNGADTICHCSAFPECSYQMIAADTGAKLVCKNGVADTDCAALGAP